jgi:predicted component of viral defense system (DUF524 family)
VTISANGTQIGAAQVEVRSKKLDYLKHFRWMLRDIADEVTEIIMERFAPTEQHFAPDDSAEATTLYQRFAFLRSILADESLRAAFQHIVAQPHVAWEEEEEERQPSQGMRSSASAARRLVQGTRRVPSPPAIRSRLATIPHRVLLFRTETTVDTIPNRFIKFALTRWRDVLLEIETRLRLSEHSIGVQRGLLEIGAVMDQLDGLLGEELFREVGRLEAFPGSNQVLHKKEGYRDVFRAYLLFELAAKLAWKGGEDVYGAGQRDVAALYEYWVFIHLARIVSSLAGAQFDLSKLVESDPSGLGLSLRRGKVTIISGVIERLGRRMRVQLGYNQTFAAEAGSWSREMRPDYSLQVFPEGHENSNCEPVWLHFDAKYRVDNLKEIFEADQDGQVSGEAKRSDLLKMHTYRDAIRRSVGAYVLYPGSERRHFQQYHEILPGLGAFSLRPTESGVALGAGPLEKFLSDVLDHVASQVTQHERGRYWTDEVYAGELAAEEGVPLAKFLRRPPADTQVLLGYVRGDQHLDWIHKNRIYNLRATGSRGRVGLTGSELAVEFIVLFGPSIENAELWRVCGEPELHTRDEMIRTGYPRPRTQAYYCLPIEGIESVFWSRRITPGVISAVRSQIAPGGERGRPLTTTWFQLVKAIATTSKLTP